MGGRLTLELIEAAKRGDPERCDQLLLEGADINGKDGVSTINSNTSQCTHDCPSYNLFDVHL